MVFLIVLTLAAVVVAVGALQNGGAVTVTVLVWQFEAPLALVILGAMTAGLVIGGLIGFARAWRRWRQGPARPGLTSFPQRGTKTPSGRTSSRSA